MTGIDDGDFAACLFVGFHTRAGTPGGLLCHTWVGALVHEIRLQGQPAGETLLDAAIAGHYGTPVVLVTGGDDVCREARADLGDDLETVAVKRVLGTSACASLTPAARAARDPRGRRARRGARARSAAPWTTTPPVVMEVEFHRREMREKALRANVGESSGERAVRYEARRRARRRRSTCGAALEAALLRGRRVRRAGARVSARRGTKTGVAPGGATPVRCDRHARSRGVRAHAGAQSQGATDPADGRCRGCWRRSAPRRPAMSSCTLALSASPKSPAMR